MNVKLAIKSQVAVIFAIMGILLALGIGIAVYTISYGNAESHFSNTVRSAAYMTAAVVQSENIDDYLSRNGYKALEKCLNGIIID